MITFDKAFSQFKSQLGRKNITFDDIITHGEFKLKSYENAHFVGWYDIKGAAKAANLAKSLENKNSSFEEFLRTTLVRENNDGTIRALYNMVAAEKRSEKAVFACLLDIKVCEIFNSRNWVATSQFISAISDKSKYYVTMGDIIDWIEHNVSQFDVRSEVGYSHLNSRLLPWTETLQHLYLSKRKLTSLDQAIEYLVYDIVCMLKEYEIASFIIDGSGNGTA